MRLLTALLILPASVAALLWLAATQFGGSAATVRPPSDGDDGVTVYSTRCVACHQADGKGIAGYFPPLDGTEWVLEEQGRLIRVVLHGLTGPTTVQDVEYNGAMPSWGSVLTDGQIASVLTYIRSEWSNNAPAVTEEDVQAVRSLTSDRTGPWTHDELESVDSLTVPHIESDQQDHDEPNEGDD